MIGQGKIEFNPFRETEKQPVVAGALSLLSNELILSIFSFIRFDLFTQTALQLTCKNFYQLYKDHIHQKDPIFKCLLKAREHLFFPAIESKDEKSSTAGSIVQLSSIEDDRIAFIKQYFINTAYVYCCDLRTGKAKLLDCIIRKQTSTESIHREYGPLHLTKKALIYKEEGLVIQNIDFEERDASSKWQYRIKHLNHYSISDQNQYLACCGHGISFFNLEGNHKQPYLINNSLIYDKVGFVNTGLIGLISNAWSAIFKSELHFYSKDFLSKQNGRFFFAKEQFIVSIKDMVCFQEYTALLIEEEKDLFVYIYQVGPLHNLSYDEYYYFQVDEFSKGDVIYPKLHLQKNLFILEYKGYLTVVDLKTRQRNKIKIAAVNQPYQLSIAQNYAAFSLNHKQIVPVLKIVNLCTGQVINLPNLDVSKGLTGLVLQISLDSNQATLVAGIKDIAAMKIWRGQIA